MMKNKTSICILFFIAACVFATAIWFQTKSDTDTEEKDPVVLITDGANGRDQQDEPDDETVSADVGHAYYYLVLEDGYLSVYYGADRSFYGYTDIRFDTLDQQTQKEILKGLSFATEEELYEFLENHSS